MSAHPISEDVAAAFGNCLFRGNGPSHSELARVFLAGRYGDDDQYTPTVRARPASPTKLARVLHIFKVANRQRRGSQRLVEAMRSSLRTHGSFTLEPLATGAV